MQHHYLLTITLAIGLFLSGCAEMKGYQEGIGTVLGGAVGGFAGHEIGKKFGAHGATIGTLVGGLAGGILGNRLGKYLDDQDYNNIATTLSKPEPQTQTWCSGSRDIGVKPTNCEGKNQVTVTTSPITMLASGQQCREYKTEVQTPEGLKTVTDKACRGNDGNWKGGQTTACRDTEDQLDEST